jgi:serine/threonine-protein kinase
MLAPNGPPAPAEPPAEPVGQRLGGYRIVRALAEGGMAVVYEGEHPTLHRPVAIKVLRAEMASHREAAKRFWAEAIAISRISHPGVVTVFDHGFADDGRAYLVMELLKGEDLATCLEREGTLDVGRTVAIGGSVAEAVAAAHDIRIIHRDLKPENIFLCQFAAGREHVKVLDFGVAKMRDDLNSSVQTRAGAILGTPHYMSPEQMSSAGEVDTRSDIYALGCILYEMLAGQVPFKGGLVDFGRARIRKAAPLRAVNPRVPLELERLVGEMIDQDPERRPSSMMVVADRLRAIDHEAARTGQGAAKASARAGTEEAFVFSTEVVPRRQDAADRRWQVIALAALAFLAGGIAAATLSGWLK